MGNVTQSTGLPVMAANVEHNAESMPPDMPTTNPFDPAEAL
jgi:hypothetical protein